jgi:hypothetical protein
VEDYVQRSETDSRTPERETGDQAMEIQKSELIEKMEEKKMSVAQAAEAIDFNPMLLGLYLVNDTYPMPKRILEKLAGVVNN